jgi:hypothetical protein
MRGEGGQAALEWVALVLVAALVLGAAAAFSSPAADSDLGDLVARRIAQTPGEPSRVAAGSAGAPEASAPATRASAPPERRTVDAFRRLRGVAAVAKRAWIVCLGYRRWRYELAHPSAPTEPLPLGEAVSIANDCLNPHDYLFAD